MATHNQERRAALDKKRKETEPAGPARPKKVRKANDPETHVTSGERTIPKSAIKRKRADNADEPPRKKKKVAVGPQTVQQNTTKRKRADDAEQLPRKKTKVAAGPQTVQKDATKRKRPARAGQSVRQEIPVESDDTAARGHHHYRAPEGSRKSGRIAGRPAEDSGSLPTGQYARVDDNDEQVSELNLITVTDAPVTGDTNIANEPSARNDERVEEHPQDLREVFAISIGTHRIVRDMTKEYTAWVERIHGLRYARGGLVELERKFRRLHRDMESYEEEKEAIRVERAKKLDQISGAQAYVDDLTTQLRDLNAKHAVRSSRIYEFVGIRENHAELSFLPPEFWAAYKDCNAAYTACKDVELKIQDVENEQFDVLGQLDERMVAAVRRNDEARTRELDEAQNVAFWEPFEEQAERLNELCDASMRLSPLHESLELARDKQFEEESKLNQIAEEAFVAAGYFRAVDNPDETEFFRRVPSKSDSAEPEEQHHRSSDRSPDKSALTDRVRRARKNLRYHQKRLQDARWQPLSDAGSLDSDAQGEPRVRRWIKRTREVREAEEEYRSARHRAQDENAMSDSDQSSNFRDHISDGYAASTLRAYGYPIAEKKKNRIHNWMSPSSRHRKKQQARQAAQAAQTAQTAQTAQASDKEGSWVDHVESMGVGEDIEGRDVDRRKERIDAWEMERDRLRGAGPFENAENDFHPQNSSTAADFIESGQYEDAVPMELDEDDSEDIRGSPNNPRVLYNPDALAVDLIDSDHQAAQWIERHFNGNGGRGQALLYDPSAPLTDYAIEGYDGENMDGIE